MDNVFVGLSEMMFGPIKGGKLHNTQRHFGQSENLFVFIVGYTHMRCLTYYAFLHLSEHWTSLSSVKMLIYSLTPLVLDHI